MDAITKTCETLMRSVVRSGAIRTGREDDISLSVRVMREELKALVDTSNPKYENEREVALSGRSGLAMAALTAECILRITQERAS